MDEWNSEFFHLHIHSLIHSMTIFEDPGYAETLCDASEYQAPLLLK